MWVTFKALPCDIIVIFYRKGIISPSGPTAPCISLLVRSSPTTWTEGRTPSIGGEQLTKGDYRDRRVAVLRDRLFRLSQASLRINESLDLNTVLQEVVDSTRSLTGACYGGIITLDSSLALKRLIRTYQPAGNRKRSAGPGTARAFGFEPEPSATTQHHDSVFI